MRSFIYKMASKPVIVPSRAVNPVRFSLFPPRAACSFSYYFDFNPFTITTTELRIDAVGGDDDDGRLCVVWYFFSIPFAPLFYLRPASKGQPPTRYDRYWQLIESQSVCLLNFTQTCVKYRGVIRVCVSHNDMVDFKK